MFTVGKFQGENLTWAFSFGTLKINLYSNNKIYNSGIARVSPAIKHNLYAYDWASNLAAANGENRMS